ncbi:potassium channel protein, putative [Bodo saltans]|uniref:Potassium channel protein, putative n=1 Tax=Bodo saltans TaxID=75058 RepID=A0A0S4IIS8_BODSA|nr:potassium channel protein, putative [Bodo saltans]|eukprot:CUE73028.1 potassium channel protein, putative [Bodo saltans]
MASSSQGLWTPPPIPLEEALGRSAIRRGDVGVGDEGSEAARGLSPRRRRESAISVLDPANVRREVGRMRRQSSSSLLRRSSSFSSRREDVPAYNAASILGGDSEVGNPRFDSFKSSSTPSLDSEDRFFLREARVTKDILHHLTEDDDGGFDDTLFLSCQGFLKAHHVAVGARRDLRKKVQDRALRIAERKRMTTFWARTLQMLDDPRSSFHAFMVFVTVATLVVASTITTIISTLPAYNPIVKSEYLILWNLVDLALGLAFTAETGLRFLSSVFDTTMPTSKWQNGYRFFTKPSNLIDLVSIAPSYVQLVVSPSSRVITGTLRTVRLLRLFKILRFYKPVRMLQKALKFAGKGLVAPMLFLITILVFISAGAYFSEDGEYDPSVHKFLIDNDPVCVFEPSYFLTLLQRVPDYVAPTPAPTAFSNVTGVPTPVPSSLPPGVNWESSSTGSSSSNSVGFDQSQASHGTEKVPDASNLGPVINHLDCPVSQSNFINIIQCTWWGVSTMSTTGFGDMVTVTGIGRVLSVFGILAGIILNAMPIAVIDASFVTTLQTEEDQETREEARRKRDDANVKLAGVDGNNPDDNGGVQRVSETSIGAPPPHFRLDDDDRRSAKSASSTMQQQQLDTSLLAAEGGNASFFARSALLEQEAHDRQLLDEMTPRTQAELLLLHLQLLSKAQVIDLANPSDVVLYLLDTLLEASVTNTAAELAMWHNKQFQHVWGSGGGAAAHDGAEDSNEQQNNNSKKMEQRHHHHHHHHHHDEMAWCPPTIVSLPIWVAKTQTNIAREAQVAGLLVHNPLGEQREVFAERLLLTQPLRLPVGWDPSGGPLWGTGGDEEDSDEVDMGARHKKKTSSTLNFFTAAPELSTTSVNVLDRSLLLKFRRSRREAIARSVLLPSRLPAAAGTEGGAGRARGITSARHKPSSSPLAPTTTASSRFQPLDFSAILDEHCWIVLHQAWGRTSHLLVPRRPPAVVTSASHSGYSWEEECNTVQLLRFQPHSNSWEIVVPFLTENKISATTTAVAATLHQFRSRVSVPCNIMSSGAATALCGAREQLQLSRGTTLSTRNNCEIARQLLTQFRRRSHFDTLVALDKQLAASRMTYRAQRQAKEQEEAKKARSAKAKKDAETRDLLDALSSEKKEAYALLQRLDLDIGSAASSSDRLSLLALASTAADKLERERAAERSITMKRFAQMTRVCSEEQSPRYLLQPGDVILLSGGSSLSSHNLTSSAIPAEGSGSSYGHSLAAVARRVAGLLPAHDEMMSFAASRVDEQTTRRHGLPQTATNNFSSRRNSTGLVGSPRVGELPVPKTAVSSSSQQLGASPRISGGESASFVTPWPSLDELSPLLGNTLLYVYNGS